MYCLTTPISNTSNTSLYVIFKLIHLLKLLTSYPDDIGNENLQIHLKYLQKKKFLGFIPGLFYNLLN